MEKKEILISPFSAKKWQVVERPEGERPLERNEVKVLYTTTSKQLAVAFAEGRQSITGQVIRIS